MVPSLKLKKCASRVIFLSFSYDIVIMEQPRHYKGQHHRLNKKGQFSRGCTIMRALVKNLLLWQLSLRIGE